MPLHDIPRAARRFMVVGLLGLGVPLALTAPALAASGPAPSHATVYLGASSSRAAAPRVAVSNLPAAFNQHTQDLTANPVPSDPTTCITRTIGLDGGHYTLQLFFRPNDNSGRVVNGPSATVFNNTTKQNTWTWRDCLIPDNGFYDQTSTVTAPDGESQTLPGSFVIGASGSYVWGSALQPGSDVH